jgi:L-seryl-tRNA(Sec) selenium transferase (EC 2.9.1.1)
MNTENPSLFSQIPATDRLLRDPAFTVLVEQAGHSQVVALLRQMQDEARAAIRENGSLPDWCQNWPQAAAARLAADAQTPLRPVFNLTGTVLHTNLGRALQAEVAVEAVAQVMRSPVTLEYSLDGAGGAPRQCAGGIAPPSDGRGRRLYRQ